MSASLRSSGECEQRSAGWEVRRGTEAMYEHQQIYTEIDGSRSGG